MYQGAKLHKGRKALNREPEDAYSSQDLDRAIRDIRRHSLLSCAIGRLKKPYSAICINRELYGAIYSYGEPLRFIGSHNDS